MLYLFFNVAAVNLPDQQETQETEKPPQTCITFIKVKSLIVSYRRHGLQFAQMQNPHSEKCFYFYVINVTA